MLYLASDHAGFQLKEFLKDCLKAQKTAVEDLGPASADRVDYPDYAQKLGELVQKNETNQGVLICGTGLGISIAANKIAKIRATPVTSIYAAQMAREHNNANVLCLGARILAPEFAWEILKTFLDTKFAGGRHQDRLDKISALE